MKIVEERVDDNAGIIQSSLLYAGICLLSSGASSVIYVCIVHSVLVSLLDGLLTTFYVVTIFSYSVMIFSFKKCLSKLWEVR